MIGRTFGRLLVVIIGFIISIFVGGSALIGLAGYYVTKLANNQDVTSLAQFFDNAVSLLGAFMAPVTLLPAMLVILVGELAGIRALLYYIVAGGAAAVVMPLVSATQDGLGEAYSGAYFGMVATAGFAGGLAYWLLAGRRA